MKVHHLGPLSVHVSDTLHARYDVVEKAFPPDLLTRHATYNDKRVHWIASFGFQHKETGAGVTGQLEETYDIELEPAAHDGAQLVYFDGVSVQPLSTRSSNTSPNKVKATLDLGDPPVGWGGH